MTTIKHQRQLMQKAIDILDTIEQTMDLFQNVDVAYMSQRITELQDEYADTIVALGKTMLPVIDRMKAKHNLP